MRAYHILPHTRIAATFKDHTAPFCGIWVVMFGTVIGVHDGSHVAVEFILKRLPPTLHKLATIGFTLCLLVLAAVMVLYGGMLAAKVYTQLSPATRIPMAYVYSSVPVCSAIMIVHLLVQLARNLGLRAEGGMN